jgi:hypothetical protein
MFQDGAAAAMLRSPTVASALVLREGEALDGWTLVRIRHDHLTFERDGQTWELGFRAAP